MSVVKKCKFFKCTDKESCTEKDCSGCGSVGYQNCGCDVCIHKSMIGDMEVCEVGLCLEETEMED